MNTNKIIVCGLCLMCISIYGARSDNSEYQNLDCRAESIDQIESCWKKIADLSENEMAEDITNLNAWYRNAESFYHLGKYDESYYERSYRLCDQALENENFQGDRWLNNFRVLRADSGIAYEKATGEKITAGPGDQQSEAYQEAFELYDEALRSDPNNTRAWNNKGVALAEMDNSTGAIYCFDKAIEINPTISEAWNNKGAALGDQERHKEALACYAKAHSLNPSLAEAWYNEGRSLDELGMDGAEECRLKGKKLNDQLSDEAEFKWLYIIIVE